MPEPVRVSVVIPTFRRRESVVRALAALRHQTLSPAQYEVIVAVDGSDDGTYELVSGMEAPFGLRGIWCDHRGRAGACNAGIAAARGDLIVVLDDDMEPSPDLLGAHVRAHDGHDRRAVMGAVPITILSSDPGVVRFVGEKFNAHLDALATPGYPLKLKDFYTGNFSIRAAVLREVGYYDEEFREYGNEDLELAVRLRRNGVEIVFEPAAWARQHYLKSLPDLARDQMAKGRTAVLLARKHPAVLGELKLSAFDRGSRKWRALRQVLLGFATVWPRSPELLTRVVARMTERNPQRARRLYPLLMDYLFWVGASAARRQPSGGSRLSHRADTDVR
jgi:glycosyltransferase involved in cell wall biosynthesis